MKRKRLFTILLSSALSLCAMADGGQQITINGNPIDRTAVSLTFEGSQLTLHFSDGTTATTDMSLVNIIFPDGVSTVIDSPQTFVLGAVVEGNLLHVAQLDENVALSVFNSNGQEVARTVSKGHEVTIDMSHQPAGVYLLRAGKQVVKFTKK